MKTPYANIYSVLRFNRIVVITIILGSIVVCMVSGIMIWVIHREMVEKAFVVNAQGNVIPLRLTMQRENLEVEALDHLRLFHNYFYGHDADGYERNIEKSLWLGDISVSDTYRQKKADGLYNRLLQYSLIQKVLSVESTIDLKQEPYPFQTVTVFEINRGSVTDTYELVTTGKLIHVERSYPRNTHGLLIIDFFENSLRKREEVAKDQKLNKNYEEIGKK